MSYLLNAGILLTYVGRYDNRAEQHTMLYLDQLIEILAVLLIDRYGSASYGFVLEFTILQFWNDICWSSRLFDSG